MVVHELAKAVILDAGFHKPKRLLKSLNLRDIVVIIFEYIKISNTSSCVSFICNFMN